MEEEQALKPKNKEETELPIFEIGAIMEAKPDEKTADESKPVATGKA